MTRNAPSLVPDDELAKEGFTEIRDAQINRIDLVGAAANGTGFLLMKGSGGASMLADDDIRALITKGDSMTDTATAPVDTEPVTKADPVEVADLIADAPGGSTAESVPGSPDWEIRDADTAQTVIGVLARVRAAVAWLAGREAQEAVTEGGDGAEVWSLEDANGAIDYALSTLASFAAGEKIEAELGEELVDAIGKAAHAVIPASLDTIDQLAPLMKAGRVLSAANEGKLRTAADNLSEVLGSLPSAPEAVEKKGSAVTDTTTPDAPVIKSTEPDVTAPEADTRTEFEKAEAEAVAKIVTDPVVKADPAPEAAPATDAPAPPAEAPTEDVAKADAMTAVFDQNGKLIGAVKPAAIIPLEGGAEAPAADEPAADDLTPAPADTVGEGATDAPAADEPVEKGAENIDDLVKSAKEGSDPLAKQLAEALEARNVEFATLLKAPAPGGPLVNGAIPPVAGNLRGQDAGAPAMPGDVTELRKAMQEGATPAIKEAAANKLQDLAVAQFAAMRSQPPTAR